jgi:hypothetical protein
MKADQREQIKYSSYTSFSFTRQRNTPYSGSGNPEMLHYGTTAALRTDTSRVRRL